jgi:hypothetical protein
MRLQPFRGWDGAVSNDLASGFGEEEEQQDEDDECEDGEETKDPFPACVL